MPLTLLVFLRRLFALALTICALLFTGTPVAAVAAASATRPPNILILALRASV